MGGKRVHLWLIVNVFGLLAPSTWSLQRQAVWHRQASMDGVRGSGSVKTVSTTALGHCSQFCLEDEGCFAFTFSITSRRCYLHATQFPGNGGPDSGALTFYRKLSQCPADWTMQNGIVCFVSQTIAQTWTEANARCAAIGGHLATAASLEKREALQEFAVTHIHSDSWIGGQDPGSGVWVWLGGQGEVGTANWISGEPTDSSENCMGMEFNFQQYFADQCHSSRPYICEVLVE